VGGGFVCSHSQRWRRWRSLEEPRWPPKQPHFPPKVKRVILLWRKGGSFSEDLFDFKPRLRRVGNRSPSS